MHHPVINLFLIQSYCDLLLISLSLTIVQSIRGSPCRVGIDCENGHENEDNQKYYYPGILFEHKIVVVEGDNEEFRVGREGKIEIGFSGTSGLI